MIARAPLLFALICLTAGPSAAEDAAPATEGGRYSLQEVRAGYLRLDRGSGEVSLCRERDRGWTCDLIADDRTAYSDEIVRLERDNATLAKRVAALEARLDAIAGLADRPLEGDPLAVSRPPVAGDETAMDDELDQALDVTERAMRRFLGMLRGIERDFRSDETAPQ